MKESQNKKDQTNPDQQNPTRNKAEKTHPTLWIQGHRSLSLAGKTVVLGVTGSIGAVRVVELARELIRNGAEVHAVMTEAAKHILHPDALHYATGNPVITELGGRVEHVEFCGFRGRADLLLIAPATANTIGKIACGIDDTTVTSFATTALGSDVPVMIVPAMHESMYRHPAVTENIAKLKSWGISIVGPRFEEGVAKIASNEEIVLEVERALGNRSLENRKVIITGGSTAESIDPIRILTNRASGKTGRELALEAYRRGADVTLVHRDRLGFAGIREVFAESAAEMTDAVLSELENGYEVLISSAAIADYTAEPSPEKIKSGGELVLKLKPTRKLIKECRERYPELVIIGFKAETGIGREELLERAATTLEGTKLDMIAANDVGKGGMGTEENELYLLGRGKSEPRHVSGNKRKLAASILEEVPKLLNSRRIL
ncbi:bifunctional phosphopantothenoylcysteine decarboxylase/phosphopantothenate--cysteine ligase CoaBC [Methanosarcina horonobensis]|uniref:bifunctional phosphopantothenoylcysteine decarboxylase/phosphopantothenate--cysteine ligase CoaBC n=1 Tax=Methanosarcina horonobensis TaxID=418008 RepID=UPI000A78FE7B|nr:bifunctional phosphopantothenoylcysteine decarboxylase/phosphopantothenate--cysteine ligase CoaBC [Methanosarcina horonobensis]